MSGARTVTDSREAFRSSAKRVSPPNRSGKDSVRFRHSQALPYDLVGEICDEVLRRR